MKSSLTNDFLCANESCVPLNFNDGFSDTFVTRCGRTATKAVLPGMGMRGGANEKSGAYEELPICHHHSEFPPILPPPPPNPHQWSFQFDKLQFISWIWPVTLPPPSFAMESEIKQTTRRGRKSGVVRTSALVQISLQLVGGNCHFYCTAAPVCPINWKHFLYQITWIGERTEITGIDYKRRRRRSPCS